MKTEPPNPNGKHGKPITLAPMKFDDALKKMLATPPPEKPTKITQKKRRHSVHK